MSWLVTDNIKGAVPLSEVPVMEYSDFHASLCEALSDRSCHVASYFAVPDDDRFVFYCLLLDDRTSQVLITSHHYGYYQDTGLETFVNAHPLMHVFEREISERYAVRFNGSPWKKPLRYPAGRADAASSSDNYPFYRMDGESLHEVNVGPIHAGIIEPGTFRFICNGETVLHLEIALGYQHRGIEELLRSAESGIGRIALAESIAGDSAVSHAAACALLSERLSGVGVPETVDRDRAAAIELERIAMHIGDTGALCGDIGYQLGQVACEALRTVVINTTQLWCGNRFGKGWVRTGGSHYPLTQELKCTIVKNLGDVRHRYDRVRGDIKSSPSVLARFEECGTVELAQMSAIGAVGVAARASGLARDVRRTHPWGVYAKAGHEPVVREQGDVMARLMVRSREVLQSLDMVLAMIEACPQSEVPRPVYGLEFGKRRLAFSLVEGWRGEICHCAITDDKGKPTVYKVKDPSLHNWMALALSMRGGGISDFPICNKSFNLSYCGHDL